MKGKLSLADKPRVRNELVTSSGRRAKKGSQVGQRELWGSTEELYSKTTAFDLINI
jgi:hypothetical protein